MITLVSQMIFHVPKAGINDSRPSVIKYILYTSLDKLILKRKGHKILAGGFEGLEASLRIIISKNIKQYH